MMDVNTLSKAALFRGVTPQETESLLSCLGAEQRRFAKGQTIYRTGDVAELLDCQEP